MRNFLIICAVLLSACRSQKVHTDISSELKVTDTVFLHVVPVDKIEGQVPEIGQKLSIPALNIEIMRISEDKALVKQPVRQETKTETKTNFVQTSSVDKSDNRTYTDSYNRTNDKSRQTDKTDNSQRTQTSEKTRNSNNIPWWLWLLLALYLLYQFRRFIWPASRLPRL